MGKANNLKARVATHLKSNNSKERLLISQASKIDFIIAPSELEALLVEASLIKKHQPFFNTRAKDDKHPLYIKITSSDQFPRVFTTRRENEKDVIYFGPFPSSKTVKEVLTMLRGIFPFDSQKTIGKRACFWSHLGLCHPCPSIIKGVGGDKYQQLKRQYKKNVRRLIDVLGRKTNKVSQTLKREMYNAARKNEFEVAAQLRDRLSKLDYITQTRHRISDFLTNSNFIEDIRDIELKNLYELLKKHLPLVSVPKRIECFDASHTATSLPTVGMVTFIDGEPDKNFYRRFRIKESSVDDLSFLEEALKRRFKHQEWGIPDMVVIDGGKTQVRTARLVLKQLDINVPVIGLVKPFDNVVILKKEGFLILRFKNEPGFRLLQRLRDEAHRFARAYHRTLRQKALYI